MKCIAIFASGTGTNAERIISHFSDHPKIKVQLVVSNKPEAGVINIALAHHIPFIIINKDQFFRGDHYVPVLEEHQVDFIVLAGFLWKIPGGLIASFRGRIINIHPALLPDYGGKGMYGLKVHEAVLDAGEKRSGITIHYVDEQYDHGAVIYQDSCLIAADETANSLAEKVHRLEHQHYPRVIEELLSR